jgi:hypothetical protein
MKFMKEKLFNVFLRFCLAWVLFALCFDIFMVTVHYTDTNLERKIVNEISWKIDGTFKDNPDNIWYEKK